MNDLLTILDKQISGVSHFANDLGLDSLDTVEVVMAIEEVRALFVSLGKG
jgi:acyl carrier protein